MKKEQYIFAKQKSYNEEKVLPNKAKLGIHIYSPFQVQLYIKSTEFNILSSMYTYVKHKQL